MLMLMLADGMRDRTSVCGHDSGDHTSEHHRRCRACPAGTHCTHDTHMQGNGQRTPTARMPAWLMCAGPSSLAQAPRPS